jgi:hypothetical protein
MTRYVSGTRPLCLPPLPRMSAHQPTRAMQAAARRYLEQTRGLEELDAHTLATERSGVDEDQMLTDREFATAVLAADPASAQEGLPASRQSIDEEPQALATVGEPDTGSAANSAASPNGKYRVGRLEIGGGNAVLNSQILRSGAFSAPELGVPLPVVADRNSFEISLEGVSPTQDHADVLLYAISLIDRTPDPMLGTVVSFTTYQLIKSMGWSMNSRGYEQLRKVIRDLSKISLTYYDRSDPRNGRVTEGERVFNSVTRPEQNAKDQRWSIVLPPSLFRIFELRRNTLVDLGARAAIQSSFGRWLHAFVSSQKPGERRTYDAHALCQAGGLRAARFSDDLKVLRETLAILERGQVLRKSKGRGPDGSDMTIKRFAPVVATGWELTKSSERWSLEMERL